ncbi:hypothetical protein GJ744_010410 [Endocarpon pusillum]|uniref:Uncharacterized protein n=1 Tax=Endocarpon pusillum TaxID=364733 RepID=A0A8H7AG59_9EURO|nr:hypothetical protein GJ744_010410 [Endocarpon pusillum]
MSTIHAQFAAALELDRPTAEQSKEFGDSVGKWPAFLTQVDALKGLSKHYKLLVLSNVDRELFSATNAGPLEGTHFDAIIKAQDVGSYKPHVHNCGYMLGHSESECGIGKDKALQTAQSQIHDHHPASEMGIKSVWIPAAGIGARSTIGGSCSIDALQKQCASLEQPNHGQSLAPPKQDFLHQSHK